MTRPLSIGIAGTGWMAETLAREFAARPGAEIAAVLSGSEVRAVDMAGGFGARACTDLPDFLDGLDAVYVASANAAHASTARAALEARLPVLVEKPLTTSAADTADLIALARDLGVLLLENYWTLALPAYRRMRAMRDGGALGPARHLSFDFSLPITPDVFPAQFDPTDGGVLLDRAVYGLAAALDLLGPVASVEAVVTRDDAGCDVAAALLLRHEGGATAQVSVSMVSAGPNSLELGFAGGHVRLTPSLAGEALHVTRLDPPTERRLSAAAGEEGLKARLKRSPSLRRLRTMATGGTEFLAFGAGPYAPVADHFLDLLATGQTASGLVPLSLSGQVADLLDDLRRR